ncbi:hypothetical protein Ciccas_001450 [Cichlidogyrus casuarinus]|uniref:Peptidase A2 domain-containing protein n=1 Tax=Cichlidogyrus casuarinus TaxID=1844966 RepID=A0ABD2QK15_9PLAT
MRTKQTILTPTPPTGYIGIKDQAGRKWLIDTGAQMSVVDIKQLPTKVKRIIQQSQLELTSFSQRRVLVLGELTNSFVSRGRIVRDKQDLRCVKSCGGMDIIEYDAGQVSVRSLVAHQESNYCPVYRKVSVADASSEEEVDEVMGPDDGEVLEAVKRLDTDSGCTSRVADVRRLAEERGAYLIETEKMTILVTAKMLQAAKHPNTAHVVHLDTTLRVREYPIMSQNDSRILEEMIKLLELNLGTRCITTQQAKAAGTYISKQLLASIKDLAQDDYLLPASFSDPRLKLSATRGVPEEKTLRNKIFASSDLDESRRKQFHSELS